MGAGGGGGQEPNGRGPRGSGGSSKTWEKERGTIREREREEEGEEEEYDADDVGGGEEEDEGGRQRDLSRSDLCGEAVYGVFPVLNALQLRRRTCHTLYYSATMVLAKRKDAGAVRRALAEAEKQGVEMVKATRHVLNTLCDGKLHQGLVLDCSPLRFMPLSKMPQTDAVAEAAPQGMPPPVWVALDEVWDPQNFGAILRSAWCLGAAGLIVSSKNCAPLSPAVSKASAGAMEAAEVHSVHSMQNTLQDAVSAGWLVLGAAGEAGAQSCQHVVVDRPTILVLGNEGSGLRTNIKRACSGLVRVDMGLHGQGFTGLGKGSVTASTSGSASAEVEMEGSGSSVKARGVDSLNVSVATGILLHSLTQAAVRHGWKSEVGSGAPPRPAQP